METRAKDLERIVGGVSDRNESKSLLEVLGFDPVMEDVPREAWSAFGLVPDPADGLPEPLGMMIAGRAGTLDALLIELGPGGGADAAGRVASAIRGHNPVRLHLFLFPCDGYRSLVIGTFGLEDGFRHLSFDRDGLRESDLEALEEMLPASGETGLELALRQVRALDRSRVTRRFFGDFRAHRSAVAAAWTGLRKDAGREREQLALLFLSRITFLYFLQRRRILAGDDRYLVRLLSEWAGTNAHRSTPCSFYRARLVPLFFGALNRRPEDRAAEAVALGDLPYLNGGLFEPRTVERQHPQLDLPDGVVRDVLERLMERYRFTSLEAGDGAGYGVDPEVLGRVFEGLMAPGDRGDTGSFYTPAPVVSRVVKEAVATYVRGQHPDVDTDGLLQGRADSLTGATKYRVRKRLERLRVLDPACGSGAFLMGALHHLSQARAAVSGDPAEALRRDIVAQSLHGVDLLEDAALLCSLRLWLALTDGEIRPLPNLDRRIRQGDALVDPLDMPVLGASRPGTLQDPLRDAGVRRAMAAVQPAARAYLESEPPNRGSARETLRAAERRLGLRWVERLTRVQERRCRELAATAAARDLFGEVTGNARRARVECERQQERLRELRGLTRRIREQGALPFFSFDVHFGGERTSFDLIVSNPPWVRSHRWPDRLRQLASRRYEVCREPGWPGGAELTGSPTAAGAQVDLSLLFVERSLRLLAPGGVLAVLLPAKALRALYGGPIRRMLLRDLEFALLEDHALDQRSIFRADAFTAIFIGRRKHGSGGSRPARSTVRMIRRDASPLSFQVHQRDLPLFPDDPSSPWLVAPPEVVGAFRAMQEAGAPLGRHSDLRIRRGVMTGANHVLVLRKVEPKLGGIARVEAEGHVASRRSGGTAREAGRFRAHVETSAIRPLVRGADIDAFRYRTERYLVWSHDAEGQPVALPKRVQRYLRRHREVLEARAGWRPGRPLGSVFRIGPWTTPAKVAWHDLSDTLRAVALPSRVRFDGRECELIPLNTVYFIPTANDEDALVLSGLLNSLPVRTFARAIAERAKDARFRFFAWTISCLPLPTEWRTSIAAEAVREVSRKAHAHGGIDERDQRKLDDAAGTLYGLGRTDAAAIDGFDRWLRGCG